jgi:hypothetical protein
MPLHKIKHLPHQMPEYQEQVKKNQSLHNNKKKKKVNKKAIIKIITVLVWVLSQLLKPK